MKKITKLQYTFLTIIIIIWVAGIFRLAANIPLDEKNNLYESGKIQNIVCVSTRSLSGLGLNIKVDDKTINQHKYIETPKTKCDDNFLKNSVDKDVSIIKNGQSYLGLVIDSNVILDYEKELAKRNSFGSFFYSFVAITIITLLFIYFVFLKNIKNKIRSRIKASKET